ncbi:sugar ABC transporter ATP-binding protein [Agromyces bauzanensis]
MTAIVTGLTKRYGSTLALDAVDLEISSGEVHALLGHNGAGKSTVIKCLGGGTTPTSGTITIDGTTHTSLNPRSSIAEGIAVIYQHLSVIDGLTVAENLFLGQELTRGRIVVDRSTQRRLAREALETVGSIADPDTVVGELAIGQRQLVEIAKALQRNAKLLILDEPTAALSRGESERLAELLLDLKRQGIAILYVTHLLNEVMQLADRATVLQNGRSVWSARRPDFSKSDLVDAISGGHTHLTDRPAPIDSASRPRLEVESFRGPGLGPIDLTVRPGEIVALYGLIGASRTRFLNMLFGRRHADAGLVRVDGAPLSGRSPRASLSAGMALVPGDRAREGLFASLPALDNTVLHVMRSITRGGIRHLRAERSVFDSAAELLSLRPRRPELPAGRFSGGNQQKILLARWVNDRSDVKVLLLDDPTQGVDVGARREIYDVVRGLAADRGLAVVVATNEPEEVMELAHRCLVMRTGQVVDEIDVASTTADTLLAIIHDDAASRAA